MSPRQRRWIIPLCIIAVFAVLLTCGIAHSHHQAKIGQCEPLIDNLAQALKMYEIDWNAYPKTGNANLVKAPQWKRRPSEFLPPEVLGVPDGWTAAELIDPWGTPLVYVNNVDGTAPAGWKPISGDAFDLYSCGPNRQDERGGGDDIAYRRIDLRWE